jgi:general secretion pathway protein M
MIERLRDWWKERTAREQGLLVLLALVAVPTFLVYGLVRPFEAMLDRAHLARDADARALADVYLMANRINHSRRPVRGGQPIEALVQSDAENAGFTITSIGRDGVGALLSIDAVRAEPFFAWVASLRQRRGLIVTRLAARPNGDSTLSVSVRFERAR